MEARYVHTPRDLPSRKIPLRRRDPFGCLSQSLLCNPFPSSVFFSSSRNFFSFSTERQSRAKPLRVGRSAETAAVGRRRVELGLVSLSPSNKSVAEGVEAE